jgi:hypothetical protein
MEAHPFVCPASHIWIHWTYNQGVHDSYQIMVAYWSVYGDFSIYCGSWGTCAIYCQLESAINCRPCSMRPHTSRGPRLSIVLKFYSLDGGQCFGLRSGSNFANKDSGPWLLSQGGGGCGQLPMLVCVMLVICVTCPIGE